MKSAIHMTFKLASIALATALVACGGGGGGGPSSPPPPVAVLAPGIWNKADNLTSTTKFIGVVTTSASGGDVWAVTEDETAGTSRMFTGSVSASSEESFATTQGTLLTFSGTRGWENPALAQPLTLPKSTTVNQTAQQVFQFSNVSYTTSLDKLWANNAKLNDVNDWYDTWTLTERINIGHQNPTLDLTYLWTVNPEGVISGTKSILGQTPCDASGQVLALEKAVVRVSVTYKCVGQPDATFSGISFPQSVNDAGKVLTRAVWLKGPGTGANRFTIQLFTRDTAR